jgi:cysteine desulfurase
MQDISLYFDWAATAPADADIIEESTQIALEYYANPSSLHGRGKSACDKLEEARKRCADAMGVLSETLYFTSGGTESNHIPILSLLKKPLATSIAVSSLEHPAVREMAESMKSCGWKVNTIKSDSCGIITPDAVSAAIDKNTALVCVMSVNNETGAVQPIYDIADALIDCAHGKRRPRFHVDCVQAAGKIPLDIAYPGIDSAAFSAHKIGGPRGSGLLYLAKPLEPFTRGGGQESGIRSGTENLAGVWALSRCLERYYLGKNAEKDNPAAFSQYIKQHEWTTEFIKALGAIKTCTLLPAVRGQKTVSFARKMRIFSEGKIGLFSPWVLQAAFRGIPGEVMVRALDKLGFAISTGSACSSRENRKHGRPILTAMGVDAETAQNAVRFSFGNKTTKAGMDALLNAVKKVVGKYTP